MRKKSNFESHQQTESLRLAELDKKIQFIYEMAFAKRELINLGANVEVKLDDTIEFEFTRPLDEVVERQLLKRLAYFSNIGNKATEYSHIILRNQTKSDNQYLTHWYYPYKGKYHPRLIRSIFNIIKLDFGQTVLDPFVGSGTTILEAHLFGLNSIGFDISPVCIIMSKVKVTAGEVAEQLPLFSKAAIKAMNEDLNSSYYLSDNEKLASNQSNNYNIFLSNIKDERIRNFYLLARLIFASDQGRRNRKFESFEKNLNRMITSAIDLAVIEEKLRKENNPSERTLGKAQLDLSDSRHINLPDNSVDAVITSPPYSIALNYMENDKYALRELGIDIKELSQRCIGVKGSLETKPLLYEQDMQKCYSEINRVLRNEKYLVIVIGNAKINGVSTRTVSNTIEYCTDIGLKLVDNIPKKIFGLYNTMIDENVLFFQK